jgi:hypothetical protein
MTSVRVLASVVNIQLAALSGLALAMSGCGNVSLPGASSRHATVPAQAVNAASVGIIRVRFGSASGGAADAQRAALDGWMTRHGLDTPKLGYLLDQLDKGGYHTMVAVIPGDTSILDDAGVYVGGPSEKDREDLEDILIKVGGFSLGGVAAAKLQVLEVGNGWYYVGINGDGVIDGASDGKAGEFSDMLEDIGDRPACVAIPVSDLASSLDQITLEDQSRIARRLQAVTDALAGASSLCASISPQGRSELLIVFPDEQSAGRMEAAFARIRKDMELALQGSIEQGEISAAEAERERRMIAAVRATQDGKRIVLYEESGAADGG